MQKEIVKYHNDFNRVKIPNFTAQEQNILMGIISKIRDLQDDEVITFYPSDLREFSDRNNSNNEFYEIIKTLKDKFFKADFTIIIDYPEKNLRAYKTINLFRHFIIYEYKNTGQLEKIELKVDNEFSYLLNDLLYNFTSFELPEFLSLKSKYSKIIYRLLKQYKSTGKCLIYKNDWEGFLSFIDAPKSYKTKDIDKNILDMAIKELGGETNLFTDITSKKPIFENLTYTKIKDKKGRGRGGKVIGIEFYFIAQQEVKQEQKQATTTQSNENKVNNTINDLANKVKDFNRPAQKKEPQILEKRINYFGQVVSDLDAYVHQHFTTYNEYSTMKETCKIMSAFQNNDGSITTSNYNPYTQKYFEMKFENFENFKNWFNKNKF